VLLSLREIARSKLRFGLLAGAVGLLIFLILFQQALLNGLITGFIGAVDNQRSPVLVFNEQARKNVEASFLRLDQAAAVAAVDGVAESALIGENTYTVDAGGEQRDAVLFGYQLGGLGEPLTLNEGRLPAGPFEAVASAADAAKGFDLGDTVTIVARDGGSDVTITVVGLGRDLRWSVAPTMFVSYETFAAAQRAVNPTAEVVLPSLVAVAPAEGVTSEELTARIDAAVDGTESLTRQQAVDQNPGVRAVKQSFQIVLALAFVVVALVVGFFFLILTVQKARALTLLRAIGSPASYLVRNLLVQIAVVLAGGMLVGLGLVLLVRRAATSGDVPIELRPAVVIPTLVGLAVLSLLGGLASIRRVLRLDPIAVVREGGGGVR
jgi:putative ABC transport system permease protein